MIGVVGAGAVSAFGVRWRGLGQAIRDGELRPAPSEQLAVSHPGTSGSEVPALAAGQDAGDARARRLMSRAARFGAIALREAVRDAAFAERREEIGAWLGVGASGVSMEDVPAILAASIRDQQLSMALLGERGIAACNPLFTFQTLNNFTLCHGAILEGIGGPNGAFFSRGAGTVTALAEALHALRAGDCERALAGGADTSLHPVTWEELSREGRVAQGLVPGEGGAVLALARAPGAALAELELCELDPSPAMLEKPCAAVVIAPWGREARAKLHRLASRHAPEAAVVDTSLVLGDSLAAAPALAWVAALDLICSGAGRVLCLSLGTDEVLAAVTLRRPA